MMPMFHCATGILLQDVPNLYYTVWYGNDQSMSVGENEGEREKYRARTAKLESSRLMVECFTIVKDKTKSGDQRLRA